MMEYGAQCAVVAGIMMMLKLYADNLGTQHEVNTIWLLLILCKL